MAAYAPLYQSSRAAGEEREEELYFQVEVDDSFRDLLALNRLGGKILKRWHTRVVRVFAAFLGTLFLLGTLPFFFEQGFSPAALIPLMMGLFLIGLSLGYHYLNALQSRRRMMAAAVKGIITFGRDSFTKCHGLGKSVHPYAAVYALYRDKKRFFLFLDKKHSYILPESGFRSGHPAELGPFLEEKCHKKINYIR